MASADNPRLPLTSGASPIVKYTEMRSQTQPSSTSITITAMPSSPPPSSTVPSSTDPNRLKKQGSLTVNDYELRRMPTQQRRFVKKTLMSNVGYRLAKRKQLHIQR
jgi:hypothetical protein